MLLLCAAMQVLPPAKRMMKESDKSTEEMAVKEEPANADEVLHDKETHENDSRELILIELPRIHVSQAFLDRVTKAMSRPSRSASVGGRLDYVIDKQLAWDEIRPQVR